MDFAGPLYTSGIYDSDKSDNKCYIALFTCASTRAVHLELVESLDVDAFIRCFRRFTARRGVPSCIISDNAKTYKAMAKEVRVLVSEPKLHRYLEGKSVKWNFILDRSPWQGGMWERLIRSVKRCLIKIVGRASLNFVELSTLVTEIESVINCRPLTYIYDGTDGLSYALTPSHLVNGRNLFQDSNGKYFELVSTYESLSKRAKYHGRLLEHFSQRWRKEYLLNLLESFRSKQVEDKPMIKVGDIVILKNDQAKRAFWKLSRVIECFTGKDGNIRGAKVEVVSSKGKKVLNRPIQHLVPLEVASQALCNDSADKAAASAPNAPIAISATGRPKRNAALIGELRRQDGKKKK